MILLDAFTVNDTLVLTLPEKFEKYYGYVNDIIKLSNDTNETTLKLLAGLVILFLGTEKIKPISKRFKYIYFILFPALISLCYSFYLGGVVIQEYSTKVKVFKSLTVIKELIDGDNKKSLTAIYSTQSHYMLLGGLLMAIWLLVHFISWFYFPKSPIITRSLKAKEQIKTNPS